MSPWKANLSNFSALKKEMCSHLNTKVFNFEHTVNSLGVVGYRNEQN